VVEIGYNQMTRLGINHLNYWTELVDDHDEVRQNGRADWMTGLGVKHVIYWAGLGDDDDEVRQENGIADSVEEKMLRWL
jgi:hypothetical protein